MIFYRAWTRPKVLTVDLDDTLYDNAPVIDFAERYIRRRIGSLYFGGSPLDRETYQRTRRAVLAARPELADDVSLLRFRVYLELLREAVPAAEERERAAGELLRDFIGVRSRMRVSRETLDVLADLRKKYPLIGLSNGNADMNLAGCGEFFDEVIRARAGLPRKPAPDMFRLAARRAGADVSELCHIGDDGYTDVLGAVNAGALCVWQTQYRAAAEELTVLPHVRIGHISELRRILL